MAEVSDFLKKKAAASSNVTEPSGFLKKKADKAAAAVTQQYGEDAYGGTKWLEQQRGKTQEQRNYDAEQVWADREASRLATLKGTSEGIAAKRDYDKKAAYDVQYGLQEIEHLEKVLEEVLTRHDEVEQLLADPAVYADGAKATELLKEFHELQERSERELETLGELEAEIAELEAKRAALSLDGGE